jgi:hypothetical protein
VGDNEAGLRQTIAVFVGISEKHFIKECSDFQWSLLLGSIPICSPRMTGWWRKTRFRFYGSWYMPLWEQDELKEWLADWRISDQT